MIELSRDTIHQIVRLNLRELRLKIPMNFEYVQNKFRLLNPQYTHKNKCISLHFKHHQTFQTPESPPKIPKIRHPPKRKYKRENRKNSVDAEKMEVK
jgi:hypothetical protein